MFTLNCNGNLLVIDKPLVMGIINTTPDSFYEGSRFSGTDAVLAQAEKMVLEGAAILDIGGQSTRPSSVTVTAEEEMTRVLPVIEALRLRFPEVVLSVDTYYASVAKSAVEAGAGMVNDIGGGNLDPQMIPVVGQLNVPYVCMHMKGTPADMQQQAVYENVTKEVVDYFVLKMDQCRAAGIHDVIIDPGFGFAKTIEHNFKLLKDLEVFKLFERPVLVGISRKGTVYKTLGVTQNEALNGTTALNTIGLMKGAKILRVHDVKEALEAVKLYLCVEGKI